MVASAMTVQAGKLSVPVVTSASRSGPRAFSGFKPSKAAFLGKSADASLSKAVAARVAVQVGGSVSQMRSSFVPILADLASTSLP